MRLFFERGSTVKMLNLKSSRKFTPSLFVLALVAAQIIPVASANAAEKAGAIGVITKQFLDRQNGLLQ